MKTVSHILLAGPHLNGTVAQVMPKNETWINKYKLGIIRGSYYEWPCCVRQQRGSGKGWLEHFDAIKMFQCNNYVAP
jgi:hypothetical protein